jgi:hypothetical protein
MATTWKELFGNLGDARVLGISWEEDPDLVITLALPGAGAQPLRVRFVFVTSLSVNIDFGTYSGPPLVHDVRVTALTENQVAVGFDFGAAPEGTIDFHCTEIRIDKPPEESGKTTADSG